MSTKQNRDAFDFLLGEWLDGTLAAHLEKFGLYSIEIHIDWSIGYKCIGVQARLNKYRVDIQIFKDSFTVAADAVEADEDKEYSLVSVERFDGDLSEFLSEYYVKA